MLKSQRCRLVLPCLIVFQVAVLSLNVGAATPDQERAASIEYHQLLLQALPSSTAEGAEFHYVLDEPLLAASQAQTVTEAMDESKKSSLEALSQKTTESLGLASPPSANLEALLKSEPVTLVIVPGIFGEFIRNRPFEEIFSRTESHDAILFKSQFAEALSEFSPAIIDESFDLSTGTRKDMSLDQLVHVASIDDASKSPLVRMVLMNAPMMSFETLMDVDKQAETFNRRLAKYLEITGSQNIVLVGYSRGTTTALSMVAQAKRQSLPWLKNVKGLVSLSGVTFGSNLADEAANPSTAPGKGLKLLEDLQANLTLPADSVSFMQKTGIRFKNLGVWATFVKEGFKVLREMKKEAKEEAVTEAQPVEKLSFRLLDPNDPLGIILQMGQKLGLNNPIADYWENVRRFKTFLKNILTGVEQLTTQSREKWWKANVVPEEGLIYYSLSAAMADPTRSAFEKNIFEGGNSYNKSYDDISLLKNHQEYMRLSGVVLNDSQVSVVQSMFLPNVLAKMNPMQAPLNIQNLGVLSSHHWGLALQVVNKMKEGEEVDGSIDTKFNPFPREAVLKAIAGKVALDLAKP